MSEKVRFTSYVTEDTYEKLNRLSEISRISKSSLLEEALTDLYQKTKYQEMLEEEEEEQFSISIRKGWLYILTEHGYEFFLKTFGSCTVRMDNFSVKPLSYHKYDLEIKEIKTIDDIQENEIISYENYDFKGLENYLSEKDLNEVKAIYEEYLSIED